MGGILCALVTVFIVVLAARAVLSWFPVRPGTAVAQINGILFDLTEWALRPLRRVIPPAGMFDLSFLVLFFAVIILRTVVCNL
jgi:YggT family protein